MTSRVLIVCPSKAMVEDKKIGVWAEDLAAAYFTFREKGCEVTIASVSGGEVPVDPFSKSHKFTSDYGRNFLGSDSSMALLRETQSLEKVLAGEVEHYDAVYFPGGRSCYYDYLGNNELRLLVEDVAAGGKLLGCCSQGAAALLDARAPDGSFLVQGKQLACISDAEEEELGNTQHVPVSLTAMLQEQGANVSRGTPWGQHVVRSEHVISAQNPTGAAAVAGAMVGELLPGIKDPDRSNPEGFHRRFVGSLQTQIDASLQGERVKDGQEGIKPPADHTEWRQGEPPNIPNKEKVRVVKFGDKRGQF